MKDRTARRTGKTARANQTARRFMLPKYCTICGEAITEKTRNTCTSCHRFLLMKLQEDL